MNKYSMVLVVVSMVLVACGAPEGTDAEAICTTNVGVPQGTPSDTNDTTPAVPAQTVVHEETVAHEVTVVNEVTVVKEVPASPDTASDSDEEMPPPAEAEEPAVESPTIFVDKIWTDHIAAEGLLPGNTYCIARLTIFAEPGKQHTVENLAIDIYASNATEGFQYGEEMVKSCYLKGFGSNTSAFFNCNSGEAQYDNRRFDFSLDGECTFEQMAQIDLYCTVREQALVGESFIMALSDDAVQRSVIVDAEENVLVSHTVNSEVSMTHSFRIRGN